MIILHSTCFYVVVTVFEWNHCCSMGNLSPLLEAQKIKAHLEQSISLDLQECTADGLLFFVYKCYMVFFFFLLLNVCSGSLCDFIHTCGDGVECNVRFLNRHLEEVFGCVQNWYL